VVAVAAKQVVPKNPMHVAAALHGKEPAWSRFATFALKFERKYNSLNEVQTRYANFKATEAKNIVLAARNPYATFGINNFADLSEEEFRTFYLMPANFSKSLHSFRKTIPAANKADKQAVKAAKRAPHVAPNGDVDWCAQGYCSAVKNQEQCGSCWASSATETIESSCFRAQAGSTAPLAPEQIVDCDTSDGGCGGGDPRSAISYVAQAGGLDDESNYPYSAGGGQAGQCNPQGSFGAAPKAYTDVCDGDESCLQSFLTSTGPPSVCVDASSWSSYTGGVLTSCGSNIDHAVQATGIDSTTFGQPAYIVRNSWATSWGVNGFIYLAIGSNMCMIANEVTWVSC